MIDKVVHINTSFVGQPLSFIRPIISCKLSIDCIVIWLNRVLLPLRRQV